LLAKFGALLRSDRPHRGQLVSGITTSESGFQFEFDAPFCWRDRRRLLSIRWLTLCSELAVSKSRRST